MKVHSLRGCNKFAQCHYFHGRGRVVFNHDGLGLTINTHSMRKSRGMVMYKDGVPVEKIAKVLNHANTSSTLRYLGITQEEVLKTYLITYKPQLTYNRLVTANPVISQAALKSMAIFHKK